MNYKRLFAVLLAVVLALGTFAGCSGSVEDTASSSQSPTDSMEAEENEILSFRPVDCGIQSQDVYEYPFIGLRMTLTAAMREKIDSREVFLFTQEDYLSANAVSYAILRFSAPTQEQRIEEGMSVDILSWEDSLPKIGAIGIYHDSVLDQMDALTGCTSHKKIGETPDGLYAYYLSTSENGDEDLLQELYATEMTITEMHPLDLENGYSAFAEDRVYGLASVGSFTTTDVQGNTVTQDIFAEYNLTLVNIFATWCSPCVQEMPELEKLRQEYADRGIRLGVIAVVLDAKTASGIDADTVALANRLRERSGAQFPFLIPDETDMNGRLTGIQSVPESFFVDSQGNIVSDSYIGARSQADWAKIVEQELSELEGAAG